MEDKSIFDIINEYNNLKSVINKHFYDKIEKSVIDMHGRNPNKIEINDIEIDKSNFISIRVTSNFGWGDIQYDKFVFNELI